MLAGAHPVIDLYPHQEKLVERVDAAFTRVRAVVMQGGTGFGKTATASWTLHREVAAGKRAIFAANLDTLVGDTHARLTAAGVPAGFVQAGRPSDPNAPVQVCSVATLYKRGDRPPADLVIIDECHRSESAQIRSILASYPQARILGLTATPCRSDDQPLRAFEDLVCGPSNRWLMDNGYLVECDVRGVDRPLEALIDEPVNWYREKTPNGRAIVFCEDVTHAVWVAESFRQRGLQALTVTGETPRAEREEARQQLADGAINALTSVNVFVEGWDCPQVDTVILARKFGHVGSYLQAIGRGLRTAPGKTLCTVLDLTGASNLLGLPDEERMWSLTGKPRRVEKLQALRRCLACAAIFRPATRCPRCGVESRATRETHLPRVLTPAERAAIREERLSHLTQQQRDDRYYQSLVNVAIHRMRIRTRSAAQQWARGAFAKRFGRAYVAAEVANA